MQDGKALQTATSHFLGDNFAKAQNIRFQNAEGGLDFAQTTSWGMTTRTIGAMIMVHGDDDGMRVPPKVAPWQVVIVPMLRDQPEDEALLAYCRDLQKELVGQSALGEPIRAMVDARAQRPRPSAGAGSRRARRSSSRSAAATWRAATSRSSAAIVCTARTASSTRS